MIKSISIGFIALAILIWLYILITDTRVLIEEVKVNPGQSYLASGFGDLGKNKQSSLACKYFNGRKIIQKVYWYSANNIMGKDSCKFIVND